MHDHPCSGAILPSICRLQALCQFQRTTEQLLKDNLQEQRVGVLPVLKHWLPTLNNLFVVSVGCMQQNLPCELLTVLPIRT